MAQMITTKYGVYMPKVEAWTIGKIDREIVHSRSNQVKTRGGYAHPESKVCLSKRGGYCGIPLAVTKRRL